MEKHQVFFNKEKSFKFTDIFDLVMMTRWGVWNHRKLELELDKNIKTSNYTTNTYISTDFNGVYIEIWKYLKKKSDTSVSRE